jgi:hypothetical protein
LSRHNSIAEMRLQPRNRESSLASLVSLQPWIGVEGSFDENPVRTIRFARV